MGWAGEFYAPGQSGQLWNIISEQRIFLSGLGGRVEIDSLIEGMASMKETSGSIEGNIKYINNKEQINNMEHK